MSEEDGGGEDDDRPGPGDLAAEVEREFTCTSCGYTATRTVPLLQRSVHGVCVECGDWTASFASDDVVREAVERAASALAGDLLTERQALAYLLRERMDVDRQVAADVMDTSPSNVDNLQRRATEKVDAAREVLDAIDTITVDD